jgi:hypothetical protein
MRVTLRLLLIWLMAVALPVQGLAAAALVHCGPSHERMQTSAAPGEHAHGKHGGTAGQGHEPDHCQGHAQVPSQGQSQAQSHPAEATDLAQYTCGACTSCCTGLALLSALPQLPASAPGVPDFVVQLPDFAEVAQTGPDRPPRLSFA